MEERRRPRLRPPSAAELAQTFTPPPPPDFRLTAIAVPLYFGSTALDSYALLHARTAPQAPLEDRQGASRGLASAAVPRPKGFADLDACPTEQGALGVLKE